MAGKTSKKAVSKKKQAKAAPASFSTATTTEPETQVEPTKPAPKKAKSAVSSFYFKNSKGRSYRISVGSGDDRRSIKLQAVNHIMTVDASTEDGKIALEFLQNHKENEANGGAMFAVVNSGEDQASEVGDYIDRLLSMSEQVIVTLLGGEIALNRLSKGQLIAMALKLV